MRHPSNFHLVKPLANDTFYVSALIFPILREVNIYRATLGEDRPQDDFDTKRFVAIVLKSKTGGSKAIPGCQVCGFRLG
jgi:hypothetical protein